MRGEEDQAQVMRRLDELAARTARTGLTNYTSFLSPAEAQWAQASANRQRVNLSLQGGYEDAERCIACFWEDEAPEDFPFMALELAWPHQAAPGHRDVLGSAMGLGIKRSCMGDIVLMEDRGYLFAEKQMAQHIAQSLVSAGRTHLQVRLLDEWPQLEPPAGTELHDTVHSMRLDALVAAGFNLSRGDAADLICAGHVKLRHLPTERTDARVQEGDAISVRGHGRLVVEEVGNPTKKGRLPVRLTRYGTNRKRG
ncbi:MAG: hypothetical protein IKK75_10210 [Clostridia bacterium]|nr:hypothetical protein [Clostridia bacterium]